MAKEQGSYTGIKADIISRINPTVTAVSAKKGTIYRYIPEIGDPELLIKTDNGSSTNWTSVGGGGGGGGANQALSNLTDPTAINQDLLPGTANTRSLGSALLRFAHAFMNKIAIGNFEDSGSSNAANGGMIQGYADSTSSIISNSGGAYASGVATNTSLMQASNEGASARGSLDGNSFILAQGRGSLASGVADTGGEIRASYEGCEARGLASGGSILCDGTANSSVGVASGGGLIYTADNGSSAKGQADGANSEIRATGPGANAFGQTQNGGVNSASGAGSAAQGYADNSTMHAQGAGSFVFGRLTDGSSLTAVGRGAMAHGGLQFNSTMTAQGDGTDVAGFCNSSGVMTANGSGSIARGNCNASVISATVHGSMAMGAAQSSSLLTSTGGGSFAFGFANSNAIIRASGPGSSAIGYADQSSSTIEATAFGSAAHGRVGSGGKIRAVGEGAFAWGHSAVGVIEALAIGSVAAGYVTSALNSVQVYGSASFAMGQNIIIPVAANNSIAFGKNISMDGHEGQAVFGKDVAGSVDTVFAVGKGTPGEHGFEVKTSGQYQTSGGQIRKTVSTEDLAYPADSSSDVIIISSANVSGSILLPAITVIGQVITIINRSAVSVVVTPNGGDVTDLSGGVVNAAEAVTLLADTNGATWLTISKV